jgi:hypothetical protein
LHVVLYGPELLPRCFGTLGVKTTRRSFGPLTEETQERILKLVYRAWVQVGEAMGREEYTHAEGMQLIRASIREGVITPQFLVGVTASVIPEAAKEASLLPEKLDEELARIETEEKLESLLTSLPEPNPETLELCLNAAKDVLPNLRQLFLQFAQGLPHHHRGGRKKELPDPETRCQVREEIKRLRKPGVKLEDLYERLARHYNVSATTIKRIRFEEDDEQ